MKNIIKQSIVLIVFCISGFGYNVHAQSLYKINESKTNNMKLSGTSTLHDWQMNSRVFTGDVQFGFKPGSDHQLTSIKSLNFSLPAMNLKSGKNGLDKNAYKALDTDRFKNIVYKLISATVSPEKDSKYLIETKGDLSIAGITKEVKMDVYCVMNKNGTITCTGSQNLKMTDYAVQPPSFLFGAMKTGDNITLDFTLVYEQ